MLSPRHLHRLYLAAGVGAATLAGALLLSQRPAVAQGAMAAPA